MSERDYLAKAEALERLSEPEGDHELHAALERIKEERPPSTPSLVTRNTSPVSLA